MVSSEMVVEAVSTPPLVLAPMQSGQGLLDCVYNARLVFARTFSLWKRHNLILVPRSTPGKSPNRRSQIQMDGFRVNQASKSKGAWRQSLAMQRWRAGGGGLICPGAVRNQSPEATDMALAYSEANSSLSGYCSLNSRNNLCARAFCFSRRAARARIILANGRR